MQEGILTMCYGPAPYRRLAVTLARCLALHAPSTPRVLVTDAPRDATLRAHFDDVVELRPEFGDVFRQKLHLHRYSPFDSTLYVDSDSLVVRGLDETWRLLRGRPFGVVGRQFSWNHWFDPSRLPEERRRFEYPIFNGGLLYFERDGHEVFEDALSMLVHYDEWGIARIGGHVNDEPLLAVAMACRGIEAVPDGGRIMRTLAGLQGPVTIDVFRGISSYRKYDEQVSPAIVHFAAGAWSQMLEYRREAARLALVDRGVPRALLAPLPTVSRAVAMLARPLRRRRTATTSLAVTNPDEPPLG